MLGPIGSDIMAIFRLLSPDEIDRYIANTEVRKVNMPMASGGEGLSFDAEDPHFEKQSKQNEFSSDSKAKIIPIDKYKSPPSEQSDHNLNHSFKEKPDSRQLGSSSQKRGQQVASQDSSELESIGVLSSNTMRNIERERLEQEKNNQDSATVFLIKERQKMRHSKKRMIRSEAFKSYQSTSAQRVMSQGVQSQEDDNEDNYESRGILVNKRHY